MENEKLREIKLTKATKYTILTTFLVGILGAGVAGIVGNGTTGENEQIVVSDGVVSPDDKEEEIVVVKEEKLEVPFKVNAQIKTYFYDLSDDASVREKALVYYNGSYTPSTGVDYFYNNNNFEVVAAFSGEVVEKKVDPMYGVTLKIKGENNIEAIYSSLGEVNVTVGDTVKQGDILAKASNNTISSNMGNHLNFSLLKNGKFINPVKNFSKNIKEI